MYLVIDSKEELEKHLLVLGFFIFLSMLPDCFNCPKESIIELLSCGSKNILEWLEED